MRMMMLVQLPVEPFNSAVRNGTASATMKKILDDIKPEAAYFGERDGKRGGVLIVDLQSSSDVPRLAEPWFLSFNADVEFRVCMLAEDLAKANLDALGKKWG
jgi:multimeric flavodoxin WrbA